MDGTGQSVTVSVAFLDVKLQNLVNQVADFTLIRRKLKPRSLFNVGAEICRTIGGPNSSEDKFRRIFIPPSMQTGFRFLPQNLIHNTILSIKTSSTFHKCKDFILKEKDYDFKIKHKVKLVKTNIRHANTICGSARRWCVANLRPSFWRDGDRECILHQESESLKNH